MAKTERLEVRLSKEEKAAIKNHADRLGMKIGPYLVWKALHEDEYHKNKISPI